MDNSKNKIGFGRLPSLDTMYIKITLECTRNMHFIGFKLILNYLHLSKHNHSLVKLVSRSIEHIEIIQE